MNITQKHYNKIYFLYFLLHSFLNKLCTLVLLLTPSSNTKVVTPRYSNGVATSSVATYDYPYITMYSLSQVKNSIAK